MRLSFVGFAPAGEACHCAAHTADIVHSIINMNLPQRILCVFNDPDNTNMFTYFFKNHGFTVQSACSVEEGLQVCLTDPPDLVITLRLIQEPEDGLTLCQKLREASSIPIIMGWADMVPYDQDQSWEVAYQQAFDAGANACFSRVFDIADVLEQIRLLVADKTITHLFDRQHLRRKQRSLANDRASAQG